MKSKKAIEFLDKYTLGDSVGLEYVLKSTAIRCVEIAEEEMEETLWEPLEQWHDIYLLSDGGDKDLIEAFANLPILVKRKKDGFISVITPEEVFEWAITLYHHSYKYQWKKITKYRTLKTTQNPV